MSLSEIILFRPLFRGVSKRMRLKLTPLFIMSCVVLVQGCGQKGDLYLPVHNQSEVVESPASDKAEKKKRDTRAP
ncbi:lipoprotein, partial [Oleiphilus sp. HI0043]|uniref:LPS translocon maturation chaperone LptM n=1 Tax=Oleiphilus sp. HI0043 TaxID=1822233 RepID=UPI0012E7D981